ncbi:hypothetical protein [Actinomadura litoris]|uniref:hypothetical protein n=1 Tax=Actinomadura litoris TaxID=2678616 RepID=UPI001FA6E643|nr:hypothetical protein [Actinomadura litoris]
MTGYHYVLSMQWPGGEARTIHGVVEPHVGTTRQQIFASLIEQINVDPPGGRPWVLFFSLEPNQLEGAR